MYVLFISLCLLFGFVFIVSALNIALPIPNKKVYNGIICNIDKDSQTATVEYDKKSEKCKAIFCFDNSFANTALSIGSQVHIGMEVSIMLAANDKIKFLFIPKSDNEKKKISWGLLLIGLLMIGYGLYKSILIITDFLVR